MKVVIRIELETDTSDDHAFCSGIAYGIIKGAVKKALEDGCGPDFKLMRVVSLVPVKDSDEPMPPQSSPPGDDDDIPF